MITKQICLKAKMHIVQMQRPSEHKSLDHNVQCLVLVRNKLGEPHFLLLDYDT